MSTQILDTKLTDRPVIALLGMPSAADSGLMSSAALPILPVRVRSERPTEASAVVAAAKAEAHALGLAAAAANGAGTGVSGAAGANGYAAGQQKTQQFGKWAFRGLEPWSDPA